MMEMVQAQVQGVDLRIVASFNDDPRNVTATLGNETRQGSYLGLV